LLSLKTVILNASEQLNGAASCLGFVRKSSDRSNKDISLVLSAFGDFRHNKVNPAA
jgi:hypothetical protein